MDNELTKELAEERRWVLYNLPIPPRRRDKSPKAPWGINSYNIPQPTGWQKPENERDYKAAREVASHYDGAKVGFVTSKGCYVVCVDCDHCLDPQTKQFKDDEAGRTARRVVEIITETCGKTYIEVSPSGEGLHIWGKLKVNSPGYNIPKTKESKYIEIYSYSHFLTVTEAPWAENNVPLAMIQPAIEKMIQEFHLKGSAPARAKNVAGNVPQTTAAVTTKRNDDIIEALGYIPPQDLTYEEWRNVGMALEHEGIPCSVWVEWSKKDPERFKPGECEKKWESFKEENQGEPVTGNTIFKMAKQYGWKNRTYAAMKQAEEQEKTAKNGDVSGGEDQLAWPYVRTMNRDGKKVSVPYPHTENLRYFLEDVLHVTVRLNTVSKKVEFSGDGAKQFANNESDPDPDFYGQRVKDKLQEYGIKGYTLREVLSELNTLAAMNQYSPVCDYLDECYQEYDGKDYMKELFSMLELDPDVEQDPKFLYILFQKWLVAAVQIAFNTLKNLYTTEGVLVFIGNPGIGKTRFFGEMLLKDHPEWLGVGQKFNPNNKDNALELWSFWIYELADYNESGNKEMQNDFKRYIDRPYDSIRPPYAVGAKKWPRTTIMFGTSNESNFLRDETGNRRYWPIALKAIHIKKDFNARQLWGQAMKLWKDGTVKPYLEEKNGDYDRLQALNVEHSQKTDTQMAVEDNYDWNSPIREWGWKKPTIMAQELNGYLNPYDKYSPTNVGSALTQMKSNDKRIKFTKRKGYYVPPFKGRKNAGNTQDGKQG